MTPQQLYQQAIKAARAGRFEEADAAAARLVRQAPKDAAGWALKGQLRMQLDDPQGALEAYDRAVALRPDHAVTHLNRGAALGKLERREAALEAFDRAVALDPGLPQAHANRAETLNALSRHEAAQAAAEAAIALKPDYGNAWSHLGASWFGRDRFEEALAAYRQAVAVQPGLPGGLTDIGMALTALGRWEAARAALDLAEARDVDPHLARYRRAHVRLMLGDFDGGWADYEERFRTDIFRKHAAGASAATPAGSARPDPADFEGRSVLVISEQGIGDEIMFAGIVPDLAARAGSVGLTCDPRLVGLFSRSFPDVEVIAARPSAPPPVERFDRIVAAGSLGYAFRRRRADFPGRPYLSPRPEVVAAWRERLGPAAGRRRIGLSWRGGTLRTNAAGRSLRMDDLAPLLALPGCEFVSLQYGDVTADLEAAKAAGLPAITAFPKADIDDFEQLAGLVLNLDLVVSVQTALIHLTGAIGHPCYVMIPKKPEWRYMAAGETMPWYGSVRLVRQAPEEAWTDVVSRTARLVAASAPAEARA